MNNKYEIDEKKWRKLDIAVECILDILACIIAQMIAGRWFDDSLIVSLIIVIIAVAVFTFVKQFILSVISTSDFLRKPFEKKQD